ncbi:MAG: energy transducer TonB [Acidobacteriaceae bacterium]
MRPPPPSSAIATLIRIGVAALVLALAVPLIASSERKVQVKVQPEYPALAKRMGVGGIVRVQATVAPSGKVDKAVALSGHPLLMDAARNAILRWRYAPSDTESQVIVDVDFELGK